MKFNQSCANSVLQYVEKAQTVSDDLNVIPLSLRDICENNSQFSKTDIFYALKILNDAHYIDFELINVETPDDQIWVVLDITYEGHKYLRSLPDSRDM